MTRSKGLIIALIIFILLLMAASSFSHGVGSTTGPYNATDSKVILFMNLTGTVNAGTTNMFRSELSNINNSSVKAVIINVNAGGGMIQQALDIDRYINSTEDKGINVYAYIQPGGTAIYTGTYIAMDATGVYMAPGTLIGASQPDLVGGTYSMEHEDIARMGSLMGSMASSHGRNSTAAMSMVLNNSEYSNSQASSIKLSSGSYGSIGAMLAGLNLSSYGKVYANQSLYDQFLDFIANPFIAGIFILIGILAVFLDLYHGTIVLSVTGVVMIALGLLGADIINASIFGLVLLLLAGILIFLEFKTNHGIALLSGLIVGIAGIYFLASSYGTSSPGYSPTPFGSSFYLSSVAIIVIGILLIVYISKILKSQRREVYTGGESLIGHSAVVVTPMGKNKKGFVSIDGVQWAALNIGVDIGKNEKVIIIERKGLTLIIKKI